MAKDHLEVKLLRYTNGSRLIFLMVKDNLEVKVIKIYKWKSFNLLEGF